MRTASSRPGSAFQALLAIAGVLVSTGCFFIHLDPVVNEEFAATPTTDPARTVEFLEPMVWLDGAGDRATRGVRLLAGVYVLEAENEDFLYFRAPVPFEMRVLKDGAVVDGRDYPGGLAWSKSFVAVAPAVAYVSISETRKLHVMKIGNDFRSLEGKVWKSSF